MIPFMALAYPVIDVPESIPELTCFPYSLHHFLIALFLTADIIIPGFMELHDAARPSDAYIAMLLYNLRHYLFLYLGLYSFFSRTSFSNS